MDTPSLDTLIMTPSPGEGATTLPRVKKMKSKRRKLYDLHTWVGFHLALLMFVILFTGTVATISHEIDWLIQHDMRVDPSAALVPGEKVSFGTMQAALQAYAPNGTIQSIFSIGGEYFAYRATVMDEFGRRMFVHVDPWTGVVTGETHPLTVQRVFRDLHRYLFMPNVLGLPIVTSMGFILAISLYTGLKTARNWKTLLFRVRTDKGVRIAVGDAHKAAGLWSIWFFVIMIITGLWYLLEFGVQVGSRIAAADNPPPPISPAAVVQPVVQPYDPVMEIRPMEELVETALLAYPNLSVRTVFLPFNASGVASVQGMVGNPLIRPRANQVRLDASTGEVINVQRSSELGAYRYLNEMADPLHFGFFGGLPTKLIWFVFGLLMTGLSLSGVWLTWKRLKTKAPTRAQFATMPIMLISMFFFLAWYDRHQGPDVPEFETVLAGPMMQQGITAELRHACGKTGAYLRARLSSDAGPLMARSVSLDAEDRTQTAQLSHFGRVVSAHFDLTQADKLTLRLGERGPEWIWDELPDTSGLSCPI